MLKKGANVEIRDNNGLTVLELVKTLNNQEIITLIEEKIINDTTSHDPTTNETVIDIEPLVSNQSLDQVENTEATLDVVGNGYLVSS